MDELFESTVWREGLDLPYTVGLDLDDQIVVSFSTIDADYKRRSFAEFGIYPPRERLVLKRVDAVVTGWTEKDPHHASLPGGVTMTIEQIARWVEGDKSDEIRNALADGIRSGRPFSEVVL